MLTATKTCLQGALIHKKDRNGDPPLLCAVLSGSMEVIRLLVKVEWGSSCGFGEFK